MSKVETIELNLRIECFGAAEARVVIGEFAQIREMRAEWRWAEALLPAAQPEQGAALFSALFPDPLYALYVEARGRAEGAGAMLRLRLNRLETALTQLPWELLRDVRRHGSGVGEYLCQLPGFSLVHSPGIGGPWADNLRAEGPLRVLLACASPDNRPRLDVQAEIDMIRSGLVPLQRGGRVEVKVLEHTTPQELWPALREGAHVLQFVGHASPLNLQFQQEGGRQAVLRGAEELQALVRTAGLRLVVLNACRTGVQLEHDWSLAEAFLAAGAPAVVAMTAPIGDAQAIRFSDYFYQALGDGLSVESALGEARRALFFTLGEAQSQWSLPRLFLRANSSELIPPRDRFWQIGLDLAWEARRHCVWRVASEDQPAFSRHRNSRRQLILTLTIGGVARRLPLPAYLGPEPVIVCPRVTAVKAFSGLEWMLGDSLARAAARFAGNRPALEMLQAKLTLRSDKTEIWRTGPQPVQLENPQDWTTEAKVRRQMTYAGPPLEAGVYEMELALTYPAYGARDSILQAAPSLAYAAFQVLSAEAQAELETYEVSSGALEAGPEREFMRGALLETFDLNDEAANAYEAVLKMTDGLPAWQNQALRQLQALFARRAEGQWQAGKIPFWPGPDPDFVRQANDYAARLEALAKPR